MRAAPLSTEGTMFTRMALMRYCYMWNFLVHFRSCSSFDPLERSGSMHDERFTRSAALHLPMMGLEGSLPERMRMVESLDILDIGSNLLSGTLPAAFGGARSQHLSELDAQLNRFTGPIPAGVGKLQHLKMLKLGNNRLSCEVWGSWSQLFSLALLELSENSCTGTLSESMLSRMPDLMFLHLHSNSFAGVLPPNHRWGSQLHTLEA
eukprot:2489770-Amphidinium_carterae.1